jgi:hypothetical protein
MDNEVNQVNETIAEAPSTNVEELGSRIDEVLGLDTPKAKEAEIPAEKPAEEAITEVKEELSDIVEDIPEEKPVVKEAVPSNPDLFIEVEDAAGVKHKITTIEDLPEDFNPKSNRQVIEILSSLNKLESDIVKSQEAAAAKEQAEYQERAKQTVLASWDREIDQLQKAGRLDKPKTQASSDKYLEDPAVKRVDAIFKFMESENKKRTDNYLTSFEDALDKFELAEMRQEKEAAIKNGNDTAKAKAGLMGRSSSGQGNDYVYHSGSARSIWDVEI